MKVICTKDYRDMSRKAANIISAQVIMKPNAVLGLATGSTPLGIYDKLIDWYHKDDISFRYVTTVNLDEYRGLARTHEQSYWYFMHEHFFNHIDIDPSHVYLPNGNARDPEKECLAYDEIVRSLGGIDLQLLGIGLDGHIGFNEPGVAFELGTHLVDLDASTIEANKRFFRDDASLVPKQAFTMGIRMIMQARKVILVANGEAKADILRKAFWGPVTPEVPASILQMHPDFTLIADREALSLCPQCL